MTKQQLSHQLKHTQILSQALQQSLRVLHMSAQELEQAVSEWVQDNPLLEEINHQSDYSSENQDWLPANQDSHYTKPRETHIHFDNESDDIFNHIADEPNFTDLLHAQVCEHPLDADIAAQVHLLIDNLDEHGYLSDSLEEIAGATPIDWGVDEDSLAIALSALQQFDPAGVGAKDLRESLILQINRLPETSEKSCAHYLIEHHLGQWNNSIAHKNLVSQLNNLYPESTIQAAIKLIHTLNPYPASGHDSSATTYIIPEVMIHERNHQWVVEPIQAAYPKLILNQEYMALLSNTEQLTDEFEAKIEEAKQHIQNLANREQTIFRIAQWLLDKQIDFFIFGAIGLIPLTIKEAAQDLNLAESTISRAINQKYLSCPQGILPFRYFFSQAVSQNQYNNSGSSRLAIQVLIETVIHQENPTSPLSDTEIVEHLAKQGITIARRTVGKYREELNIPSANQRRQEYLAKNST